MKADGHHERTRGERALGCDTFGTEEGALPRCRAPYPRGALIVALTERRPLAGWGSARWRVTPGNNKMAAPDRVRGSERPSLGAGCRVRCRANEGACRTQTRRLRHVSGDARSEPRTNVRGGHPVIAWGDAPTRGTPACKRPALGEGNNERPAGVGRAAAGKGALPTPQMSRPSASLRVRPVIADVTVVRTNAAPGVGVVRTSAAPLADAPQVG